MTLDPSVTGVIVGCVAGGSLLILIVIGVIVTCWHQKRDNHGIIIANLAAKRIHVLQLPKSEAASSRGLQPPPSSTLVSGTTVGNADLQIFHTKGRKRSEALNLSARGKRAVKLSAVEATPEHESKPEAVSNSNLATLQVDDESFMCHVHKEETPQVSPRKARRTMEEESISDGTTTRTVLSFDAFQSPDLQKASIVIDPRENVQTTIILDDTSSVATTLPYVT